MKTYGATLDATQTTTVVDYLAKSFGPAGAAAPAQTGPAPAAGGDADAAGKAIVNGLCASCHGVDVITSKQASRNEWKDVVDRMKGYGATLDEKQNTTLLDYLEKNQWPKQAATQQPPPVPMQAKRSSNNPARIATIWTWSVTGQEPRQNGRKWWTA